MPNHNAAIVIATHISGALDYLAQHRQPPNEEPAARVAFEQALAALEACDDLDELPFKWFAAFEAGRHHAYILTRAVLAERKAAVEAELAKKKAARHKRGY